MRTWWTIAMRMDGTASDGLYASSQQFYNHHQLIFKFQCMSTFKKEKAPLKPTRKARNELTEEQKQ